MGLFIVKAWPESSNMSRFEDMQSAEDFFRFLLSSLTFQSIIPSLFLFPYTFFGSRGVLVIRVLASGMYAQLRCRGWSLPSRGLVATVDSFF